MLPQGYAPAKQRERECLLCPRPRVMRNSRKRALTGLSMTAARCLPIPLGMVRFFCLSAVAENNSEPFAEAPPRPRLFFGVSFAPDSNLHVIICRFPTSCDYRFN